MLERFRGRDALDLHPVFALMRMAGEEQARIQIRLIAEQQQPLALGIEPADGIHAFGETEIGERAMFRAVGRELRDDAKGFVKGEKQGGENVQRPTSNVQR